MAKVYLVEGPVGAGKSTHAMALACEIRGVHLALDEWFAQLYSPDRPDGDFISWYVERKARLHEQLWRQSARLLAAGIPVVLELGLIQAEPRMAFCRRVEEEGHTLCVHVLDAPRDVRRARVQRRNREQGPTFAMVVPDPIFELASDLWEAPDDIERELFDVIAIRQSRGD